MFFSHSMEDKSDPIPIINKALASFLRGLNKEGIARMEAHSERQVLFYMEFSS